MMWISLFVPFVYFEFELWRFLEQGGVTWQADVKDHKEAESSFN